MIIQVTNINNAETFLEVLKEQGYEESWRPVAFSPTDPSPVLAIHIPHDRSVQCRNLCADLLDEGFKIELLAENVLEK